MRRIDCPIAEDHKVDIIGLYRNACKSTFSSVPQEVIDKKIWGLVHDLGSLHVLLAVQKEHQKVRGKVRGALLVDARDSLLQTQLLIDTDYPEHGLPELLFGKASISIMALSFKRFGFLLSDQETNTLQGLQRMIRDELKQRSPYIPLLFDPDYPGLGSANLAYFSAPFSAFYGIDKPYTSQSADLDFLFSSGVTRGVSELDCEND